MTNRKSYP